jgi:hypothetical protein
LFFGTRAHETGILTWTLDISFDILGVDASRNNDVVAGAGIILSDVQVVDLVETSTAALSARRVLEEIDIDCSCWDRTRGQSTSFEGSGADSHGDGGDSGEGGELHDELRDELRENIISGTSSEV